MAQRAQIAVSVGASTPVTPYVEALELAGFAPVPMVPGQGPSVLAPEIAGVVFAGGAAVHPARFGQDLDPAIKKAVDEPRDAMEWALADQALARGLPILGICRGMQFLNVYFGGSLSQNLAAGPWQDAHRPDLPRDAIAHQVQARAGRLAEIFGPAPFGVNSIHRQGVARLAGNFRATVTTGDGLVEGVEDAARHILAVQWHPEEMARAHPAQLRLIQAALTPGQTPAGAPAAN